MDERYLAGFIDGEGTITASLTMSGSGRKEAVHYRLLIPNTNVEVLEAIQATYGGRMYRRAKARSPKHRQVYYLYWGGADCIPVIQAVLPHLIIKKRHAEVVLALHELAVPRTRARAGISDVLLASRAPLVAEIVHLNRRGVTEVMN